MKLMLIDGNSIVNRAFFGIRELNAPDGTPTNAIYGFLAILQHLYEDQKPEAVCVAFDRREPTFRHRSYDFYKAQRKPMPEELAAQMPVLKELLDAMGVSHLELAGYEADDILGTLSRAAEEQGNDCVIVTGDKDSLQLVSDRTTVCNVKSRMGKTETILYTPERFREEYGFEPPLMVDLKALMGDSSDNIPGVPGIGEKTAMDLVRRYGSVAEIYRNLDALEIKDGVRKKLSAGQDSANSSYWLATIFREVPLDCEDAECFRWSLRRTPELLAFMKRLGFRRMIDQWRLQELEPGHGGGKAAGAGFRHGGRASDPDGADQERGLCRRPGGERHGGAGSLPCRGPRTGLPSEPDGDRGGIRRLLQTALLRRSKDIRAQREGPDEPPERRGPLERRLRVRHGAGGLSAAGHGQRL